MGGKWLELLKEVGARRRSEWRSFAIRTRSNCGNCFRAIQTAAPSFGVETIAARIQDATEIERAITAFAREPNGGLIVIPSRVTAAHREMIIALAARHKLPAVYRVQLLRQNGGLVSYGPDTATYSPAAGAMSIASSRARSRPTCRCRRRPSTSW